MAQVQVRCTVDNCYFWAQDNHCNAESILITSDAAAQQYSQSDDNRSVDMLVDVIGETPASQCQETACKTFQRR
ncbi:MAG: DUF1540 domain-containing protein [Sulfobacillus acidophilus]|uniref:DUF1540 domain-containing protein n=1 Tax=Sulfobacillus acidophilus TaxID=53633 RepID=A0A2T2WMQ7_9FIRM|nr:MAG: DUF1540 domain-containing protein [Sulfobacillus acidophilus]